MAEYYWLKHHNKDFRGTDRQIEYVDAFFKTMRALTGDDRYMQILQALDQEEIIAQGGVSVCEMLERLEQKGRAEGRAEGEAKAYNSFAEILLKAKEPVAKIIQYTQLPLEKIQELAAQIGVAVVM